jgi:hypothetical protein
MKYQSIVALAGFLLASTALAAPIAGLTDELGQQEQTQRSDAQYDNLQAGVSGADGRLQAFEAKKDGVSLGGAGALAKEAADMKSQVGYTAAAGR